MAYVTGDAGDNVLTSTGDPNGDSFQGQGGSDTITGGAANDIANYNLSTDGADSVNLRAGLDLVSISALLEDVGRDLRLTLTSGEVGNGNALDDATQPGQDGGLAVRLQLEDASGELIGGVSRYDDEGIRFATFDGGSFDVRDLITGASRGEFQIVILGTSGNDQEGSNGETQAKYINGGLGNDHLVGGRGNDFIEGGSGNDTLSGNLLLGIGDTDTNTFIGGAGNDIITGGDGADRVIVNVATDGADRVGLLGGLDSVEVLAPAPTIVRLSFIGGRVGDGNAQGGPAAPVGDVSFAVQLQPETSAGALTGALSRYDDEGVVFAAGEGVTLKVRELGVGALREGLFTSVSLGTAAGDLLTPASGINVTTAAYLNGGLGGDTLRGGRGNDALLGGAADDVLHGTPNLFGIDEVDYYDGGVGSDRIEGSNSRDVVHLDLTLAGSDTIKTYGGADSVEVFGFPVVSLTYSSLNAGNGSTDGTQVRLQQQDFDGSAFGSFSRADDEGVTFTRLGPSNTFEVFDLDAGGFGVSRGQFNTVTLGTGGTSLSADDVFTGTASADFVDGGEGGDRLEGGDGDDFLVGGLGRDQLNGGAGNDTFDGGRNAGPPDFGDVIIGGDGDDLVIVPFSVADGLPDFDEVQLDAGNDAVRFESIDSTARLRLSFFADGVGNGAPGNLGGPSDGSLAVRAELLDANGAVAGATQRYDDEGITFATVPTGVSFEVRDGANGPLIGEGFGRVVLGTSGADELASPQSVTSRRAYINGGFGDDDLTGDFGADLLVGGAGNDTLFGNYDDDTLLGGEGDDFASYVFIGGQGSDRIDLGSGDDRFLFGGGSEIQVQLTFADELVGNGSVLDGGTPFGGDGSLAVRAQRLESDGAPADLPQFLDDEGITFTTTQGGSFSLRDPSLASTIAGRFGTVTLGTIGNDGAAAAYAGTVAADYIAGGGGDDSLAGGDADDRLVGGLGADRLDGGLGDDHLEGGHGDDVIRGGAGGDILNLGDGVDIAYLSEDGEVDRIRTGEGIDAVRFLDSGAGYRLTYYSADTGNGADADVGVRIERVDANGVSFGAADNIDDEGVIFLSDVTGTLSFDILEAETGQQRGNYYDAVALGTSQNDILANSPFRVDRAYYIDGGFGDDTISGGAAADYLVGGFGNDRIVGSNGEDRLLGGAGLDLVSGGAGADTVTAFDPLSDGADQVNLGFGDDVVNVAAPVGTNVRLSFVSAEVGNGSSLAADRGQAVRMQAEAGGVPGGDVSRFDDEGIAFVGGDGVTFDVRDILSGAARGEAFEVVLLGSAGLDRYAPLGATRAHYINGGGGDDRISGGVQADFLVGGAGNDLISGGGGADRLAGNAGRDTFRFDAASDSGPTARDTVLGFVSGEDTLDLRALRLGASDIVILGSQGGFTTVSVDQGGNGSVEFVLNVDGIVTTADYLF